MNFLEKSITENIISMFGKDAFFHGIIVSGNPIFYVDPSFINSVEVVEYILNEGIDIECQNKDGSTPLLHFSGFKNSKDIVEMLLERGSEINKKNHYGEDSLFFAVQEGDIEIVKILIEKGIEVESKYSRGIFPLLLACDYGKLEIMKLLLLSGANPYQENENGETIFDYMSKNEEGEIQNIISGDMSYQPMEM